MSQSVGGHDGYLDLRFRQSVVDESDPQERFLRGVRPPAKAWKGPGESTYSPHATAS